MKKVFLMMSIILFACVSMTVTSCSNHEETISEPKLSIKQKESVNKFCKDFVSFTSSMQKKAHQIGTGKTFMKKIQESIIETQIMTYIEELDESGIEMLLNLGLTENDIEAYGLDEQPMLSSMVALSTIYALETSDLIEEDTPFEPEDIPEGFEIVQFLQDARDCMYEVVGIDIQAIGYGIIADTAAEGAVKKAVIKIVERVATKLAAAGTGIGAAVIVGQWAWCMAWK